MNAIFVASGLQNVVSGVRVMPGDAATAEGKRWIKDNAKAMFFVLFAMEYTQLECLLTCTTTKEM